MTLYGFLSILVAASVSDAANTDTSGAANTRYQGDHGADVDGREFTGIRAVGPEHPEIDQQFVDRRRNGADRRRRGNTIDTAKRSPPGGALPKH